MFAVACIYKMCWFRKYSLHCEILKYFSYFNIVYIQSELVNLHTKTCLNTYESKKAKTSYIWNGGNRYSCSIPQVINARHRWLILHMSLAVISSNTTRWSANEARPRRWWCLPYFLAGLRVHPTSSFQMPFSAGNLVSSSPRTWEAWYCSTGLGWACALVVGSGLALAGQARMSQIGRASCRERVYVLV